MRERITEKEKNLRARADAALAGNGFITESDSTYLLLPDDTKLRSEFVKIKDPKYGYYWYKLLIKKNGDTEPCMIFILENSSFEKKLNLRIKEFASGQRREVREKRKAYTANHSTLSVVKKEAAISDVVRSSGSTLMLCSKCRIVKPQSEMISDELCEMCSYNQEPANNQTKEV